MAEKRLNIGALPGRKHKALSVTEYHDGGGAKVRPLAYFRSDAAYEEFAQILGHGPTYLTRTQPTREKGETRK